MNQQDQAFNDPEVALLRNFDKSSSDYLKDLLYGDKIEKRDKWMQLFKKHDIFNIKYQLSFDELRD